MAVASLAMESPRLVVAEGGNGPYFPGAAERSEEFERRWKFLGWLVVWNNLLFFHILGMIILID